MTITTSLKYFLLFWLVIMPFLGLIITVIGKYVKSYIKDGSRFMYLYMKFVTMLFCLYLLIF